MDSPTPKLIVDWKRPARPEPQASLGRFAPDLEVAPSRGAREGPRRHAAPRPRAPRQLSLAAGRDDERLGPVALELRPAGRLTSLHLQAPGPVRPARRSDERVREALLAACSEGAERDAAVLEAARECAVPASALGFVEALLADLVLEGHLVAYGDVLYARAGRRRRKVVAVEVGEDDLMDLLAQGHRVLELK